jgi:predicted nucleic acid-binding protein
MAHPAEVGLVFDASALIDIVDTDPTLLTTVAREIAPVLIPAPVLREVFTLTEEDCNARGLTAIVPTIEQLAEAATTRGSLSEEDHLCLIVARDLGATCVTSDGALYKACVAEGVTVWRGLRPLIALVAVGHLEVRAAIVTVRAIQQSNAYITTAVIRAFVIEIRAAGKKAARLRPPRT